jgi:hypothetical protein
MKKLSGMVALVLLQGCAADLGFRVGSTGTSATQPSVGPGTSLSSSGVSARFGDSGNMAFVVGAAILGVLFGSETRGTETRPPPELDSNRRINEQDCTKPLQDTANLRCR